MKRQAGRDAELPHYITQIDSRSWFLWRWTELQSKGTPAENHKTPVAVKELPISYKALKCNHTTIFYITPYDT